MRNPMSLCAVALSLALTSPASSEPAVAFNRADWQVVEVSFPNAAINQALTKTCAGGTLAATKAAVSKGLHSGWTIVGYNTKIDLFCVKFADGQATVSPVIAKDLYLDVYSPGTMDPSYRVWAGRSSSDVAIRDPRGAELTYAAPPAKAPVKPVPGPGPKTPVHKTPVHKTPAHKRPVHKRPVHKTPVAKAPAANAAPALSPLERGWLMPEERTVYKDAVNAAKKPSKAALQLAYKNARETVAKNLRDELRDPYKADVKDAHFDKIDALLYGKNYSGLEIDLSPAEYDQLKTVLKTATEHADFVEPNAAAQYDFERKTIVDERGKAKLSEHVLAHKIAVKFRAMLPGAKPGTSAGGAPVKLTDADFAKIPKPADRDALHKAYDDEWAKADTDDKKRALNETYLKKIAALIAAASGGVPPNPATPFDPSAIKTLPQLLLRSDKEQLQFCSMLSSDGAGNCGDTVANGFDATKACLDKFPPVAGDTKGEANTKIAAQRVACEKELNACKPQPGQAAPLKIDSKSLPKDLRDHCAQLLAGAHLPAPKPSITAGSEPPDPAAKSGKDSASGENPADKPVDKQFYNNLSHGMTFGLGGLLLASFFGGPVLMLAVAAAAGIGGYYLSKSITEPKDKPKKK